MGPDWRPSAHRPGEGPGGPGARGCPGLAEGPHQGSFLLGLGSSWEVEPSLPSDAGVGRLCMLVSDECVHVHECAPFLRKGSGGCPPARCGEQPARGRAWASSRTGVGRHTDGPLVPSSPRRRGAPSLGPTPASLSCLSSHKTLSHEHWYLVLNLNPRPQLGLAWRAALGTPAHPDR